MGKSQFHASQELFERMVAYFEREQQSKEPPALIPHPDAEVNRITSGQLPTLRKAAVLIPVTRASATAESHVVLTVRSANMKSHAGQISLPGGTQNAQDADICATALRESEEEIGLPEAHVQILGRLGEFALPSGFRVTPVVGIIDAGLPLVPCPVEVADIFYAPLTLVLNPNAYRRSEMHFQSAPRKILELTYEDYRIWGATANILHHLAMQVSGE